ncbi:MAG: hydrolase 1, exosortase A system-associated [Sphingomonadaceae bacterium]
MRRLDVIEAQGARLGASFDAPSPEEANETAILFVVGGTQTRIGSHRMFARLARQLADKGYPSLRYDRRGVGDSEGEDLGYANARPDMAPALAALRQESPRARRVLGIGLCDGATALALHGGELGLDGAVLVNPWFVETVAGTPPPAAIRRRYRERLLSLSGWRDLLTGRIDYRKLLTGMKTMSRPGRSALADRVQDRLERGDLPVVAIFAHGDATAIAAREIWESRAWKELRARHPAPVLVASDAHTFSRLGDMEKLEQAVLEGIGRLTAHRAQRESEAEAEP